MVAKKTVKQTPSAQSNSHISKEGLLAITAFLLPFVAWLLASLINPAGWASHDPYVVIGGLLIVAVGLWPVTLGFGICAIFYLGYRGFTKKNTSILLMIISVLYTAYLFQLTVTASESEFAA